MAVTISLFNHTLSKFLDGSFAVGDTYKLKLYSALTPDLTDTTLAAVDAGGTEATTGTGYTAGGATLASVAVTIVSTNGAQLDAADVSWTASGGTIAASHGVIYNDTDADDPPVAVINFDGTQTAGDGTNFNVNFNASGILTLSAA
jgi:hypothetical protein